MFLIIINMPYLYVWLSPLGGYNFFPSFSNGKDVEPWGGNWKDFGIALKPDTVQGGGKGSAAPTLKWGTLNMFLQEKNHILWG